MSSELCQVCSSRETVETHKVLPDSFEFSTVMMCQICRAQLKNPQANDHKPWNAVLKNMWDEKPAVQVACYQMLQSLLPNPWARDLLSQLYLDPSLQKYAETEKADPEKKPTLDSNGAVLQDGDHVTLIKDLVVKGANFTAKRGTLVKGISLTDNSEHIEGKVGGTRIVLVTKYLKKA